MIVASSYVREDAAIVRHLMLGEGNEAIERLHEHDRDVPADLGQALRLFGRLRELNGRAKIGVVHIVVSPDHQLSAAELAETLALIDVEHGLGDRPRAVVRHAKGDRGNHYHILVAAIGPDGRAASSKGNYVRDELIGRQLEMAFGERLQAGAHGKKVREILRLRGRTADADRVPLRDMNASPTDAVGPALKQQARRLEIKVSDVQNAIVAAWREVGPNHSFSEALASRAIVVGEGRKPGVLIALHTPTGLELPLRRAMRKNARVTAAQLKSHFPEVEPVAVLVERSLHRLTARFEALASSDEPPNVVAVDPNLSVHRRVWLDRMNATKSARWRRIARLRRQRLALWAKVLQPAPLRQVLDALDHGKTMTSMSIVMSSIVVWTAKALMKAEAAQSARTAAKMRNPAMGARLGATSASVVKPLLPRAVTTIIGDVHLMASTAPGLGSKPNKIAPLEAADPHEGSVSSDRQAKAQRARAAAEPTRPERLAPAEPAPTAAITVSPTNSRLASVSPVAVNPPAPEPPIHAAAPPTLIRTLTPVSAPAAAVAGSKPTNPSAPGSAPAEPLPVRSAAPTGPDQASASSQAAKPASATALRKGRHVYSEVMAEVLRGTRPPSLAELQPPVGQALAAMKVNRPQKGIPMSQGDVQQLRSQVMAEVLRGTRLPSLAALRPPVGRALAAMQVARPSKNSTPPGNGNSGVDAVMRRGSQGHGR